MISWKAFFAWLAVLAGAFYLVASTTGCAPQMRCRVHPTPSLENCLDESCPQDYRIEVCEYRECRDLGTGRFVECPR